MNHQYVGTGAEQMDWGPQTSLLYNSYLASLGFPSGSESKESAYSVETWNRSLGWEDPLEEDMATHSSILA